jgi:hypothetical protein
MLEAKTESKQEHATRQILAAVTPRVIFFTVSARKKKV